MDRERTGMESMVGQKQRCEVMVFDTEGQIKVDVGVDACIPCLEY